MGALSRELGVDLFEKSGRSFVLTPVGSLFAEAVAGAFDILERALDEVSADSGALVLAVQPSMATSWVVPLLDQLSAASGVAIRLQIFDRRSELDTRDWDLAIVPGSGEWTEWESTTLFREAVRPLASPSLARELGLGLHSAPADLLAGNLLHIDDIERPSMTWREWFEEAGSDVKPPPPRIVYNAYPTVLQEALAGNGIVLGWHHLLSDLVERGLLVPVGPIVRRDHGGHHLCWPVGRSDDRHQAILEELQQEIGASSASFDS
jgi:LysR family glycine cleavage system transcriptional activator